ncbi:hypothetical protein T4D_12263 [Trichinella pseudospiralis]|uniref:Uncharacterized protein n=1 Tax=Trichinella pseudospiralis TaxID=6337 RepID=A0A0V1F7V2_TRIPS|nr:hypothetical protein T4D_12263 [Trichinella pseudospiralis]
MRYWFMLISISKQLRQQILLSVDDEERKLESFLFLQKVKFENSAFQEAIIFDSVAVLLFCPNKSIK